MATVVVGRAALELVPQFVRDLNKRISRGLTTAAQGGGRDASNALEKEGKRGGTRFVSAISARIKAGPFRAIGTHIGGSIVAGFAAVGLAKMGASIARFGVGAASNLEQVRIGFTTMLGSAQAADKFLKQLQQFANSTPFEFADVSKASQRLLAMGVAAQDVVPYLTAIGDAAAGLGGGADLIDQMTTALGQMVAKGKVQSDELLQLTEAGIPALKILADSYHVTTGEMQDMVTKGKVLSSDAVPKIIAGLEKGTKTTAAFGGMMEKQSHTFAGLMSTLKDSASTALANGLQPLLHVAEKLLPPAIDLTGRAMTRLSTALANGVTDAQRFVDTAKYAGLKALWAFQAGFTDPSQAVDTGFIGLAERIGGAVSTALGKLDKSGVGQSVRNLFTDIREADIGSNLAHNVMAGVKTGIDTGDWSDLGHSLGDALTKSINAAGDLGKDLTDSLIHLLQSVDWSHVGENAGTFLAKALGAAGNFAVDITAAIGEQIGKIDWFGLAFQLGKQAPTLLVGLATGVLNFDIGSLLKGLGDHWLDVILGILTLAFAPAKVVGVVARVLERVPLAGPLLRWLFEAAVGVSKGLVRIVGKIAGDFVGGLFGAFGKEVPRLGGFVSGNVSQALRYSVTAVKGFAEDFVGVIRSIPGRAGAFAGELLKAGAALIRGLVDGFMVNIRSVDNMLGNVGSRLLGWGSRAITYLWQAGIDLLRGLGGGAGTAWRYVTEIFDRLGGIVRGGVDTIRGIWGGIVDVIKAPLREVFGFLNRWAVGPINSVLGKLPGGLKIPEFPRFADGGLIPGPGGPRADDKLIRVSAGEAVIPEHLVGEISGWAARRGIPGFKNGGLPFGGPSLNPLHYVKEGAEGAYHAGKKALGTVVGIAKDIAERGARWVVDHTIKPLLDKAAGLVPGNNLATVVIKGGMDKLLRALEHKGDEKPAAPPGDPAGTLGGAIGAIERVMQLSGVQSVVTSSMRPGDGGYHGTGNAVDFGWYGNDPAHLTQIARFWDRFGGSLLELIYSGDGGHFFKNGRRVGFGFYGAATEAQHYNHVHVAATAAAMQRIIGGMTANGKARLFDAGGILGHGMVGYNLSGRDELVLNPDQTAAVLRGDGGRKSPLIGEVHVHDDVDLDLVLQRAEWRDRQGGF